MLKCEEGGRVIKSRCCGCELSPPLKFKDRVLEYLRERRDEEEMRVDAVGVRRRPHIKCKDIVLKYLRDRRDEEWMLWV